MHRGSWGLASSDSFRTDSSSATACSLFLLDDSAACLDVLRLAIESRNGESAKMMMEVDRAAGGPMGKTATGVVASIHVWQKIARVLQDQGDYKRSVQYLERCLELWVSILPYGSPELNMYVSDFSAALNQIALRLLQSDLHQQESLQLLRKALLWTTSEKCGNRNLCVVLRITTLQNIAYYFSLRQKWHLALQHAQESLALETEHASEHAKHPAVVSHLIMAFILSKMKRLESALQHAQAALHTSLRFMKKKEKMRQNADTETGLMGNKNALFVVLGFWNTAVLLEALGDDHVGESREMMRRGYAWGRRALGKDHAVCKRMVSALADLQRLMSKTDSNAPPSVSSPRMSSPRIQQAARHGEASEFGTGKADVHMETPSPRSSAMNGSSKPRGSSRPGSATRPISAARSQPRIDILSESLSSLTGSPGSRSSRPQPAAPKNALETSYRRSSATSNDKTNDILAEIERAFLDVRRGSVASTISNSSKELDLASSVASSSRPASSASYAVTKRPSIVASVLPRHNHKAPSSPDALQKSQHPLSAQAARANESRTWMAALGLGEAEQVSLHSPTRRVLSPTFSSRSTPSLTGIPEMVRLQEYDDDLFSKIGDVEEEDDADAIEDNCSEDVDARRKAEAELEDLVDEELVARAVREDATTTRRDLSDHCRSSSSASSNDERRSQLYSRLSFLGNSIHELEHQLSEQEF
eukprot:ANDGO_08393.mRNA.1 hypothetical protein GUITHDRAFT_52050